MKNVRSTLLMISLIFFLILTATGCAQTGSDTMSKGSMDKATDTMNTETMDGNMDKTMNTMDAEKMDGNMEKNMRNGMK